MVGSFFVPCLIVGFLLFSSVGIADWPTLGGDAARRGASSDIGPKLGCLKWVYGALGPVTQGVAVGAEGHVYFVTTNGVLTSLDSEGDVLWEYVLGEGELIEVDIVDGSIPAGEPNCLGSWDALVVSAVIPSQGVLGDLVNLGPTTLRIVERDGVDVLAFDMPTGGIVYGTTEANTVAGAEVKVVVPWGAFQWSDVQLYIDGRLEERLQVPLEENIERQIQTLAFSCNEAQIRVFRGEEDVVSYPSVGPDGTVYVGFGDTLYAIGADGVLDWEYETGAFVHSCPAVDAAGRVFFGSADGKVYALDSEGVRLWDFEVPGPGQVGVAVLAPPSIGANGDVYIGGLYDSALYALDPNDGDVHWECDLSGGEDAGKSLIAAPVVADDGTVYVTLINDSNLYAVDPNDGSVKWATNLLFEPRLVGYWKFDEGGGDTARDSSAYRRDGQLDRGNNDYWTGGVLGGASTRNWMQVEGFNRSPGTVARTISMWFRCRVPFYETREIFALGPVLDGASRAGEKLSLFVNGDIAGPVSGALHVALNGGFITGMTDLTDLQWHHLAVVIEDDGSTTNVDDIKIYVDGQLDSSFDSNGGYLEAGLGIEPSTETVGYLLDVYTYSVMDDLRIYEEALTLEQIKEVMWDETAPTFDHLRPAQSSIMLDRFCWSEVAVSPDGTIYVGFDDPYLRAINPDGTLKWIKHLGYGGNYTLAVGADGQVYAAGVDGVLYVIDAQGQLLTRFEGKPVAGYSLAGRPYEIQSSPGYPAIAADGTVYISDVSGKVWAISADDCAGRRDDVLTCQKLPMDINHDCVVNLADFAAIAADWMACTYSAAFCDDPTGTWHFVPGYDSIFLMEFLGADVNNDGYVDFDDIVWIMRTWLMGGDLFEE